MLWRERWCCVWISMTAPIMIADVRDCVVLLFRYRRVRQPWLSQRRIVYWRLRWLHVCLCRGILWWPLPNRSNGGAVAKIDTGKSDCRAFYFGYSEIAFQMIYFAYLVHVKMKIHFFEIDINSTSVEFDFMSSHVLVFSSNSLDCADWCARVKDRKPDILCFLPSGGGRHPMSEWGQQFSNGGNSVRMWAAVSEWWRQCPNGGDSVWIGATVTEWGWQWPKQTSCVSCWIH